jgi:hypothetical protein
MTEGVIDSRYVELCFEDASRTLDALPWSGHSTGFALTVREVLRDADDDTSVSGDPRPAFVTRSKIAAMEETFGWLKIIPDNKKTLRRIIAARSVTRVSEDGTETPASWLGIGKKLGMDYRSARRWHGQALAIIAAELNRRLIQSVPMTVTATQPANDAPHEMPLEPPANAPHCRAAHSARSPIA